jgi:hypothetical protein
MALQDVQAGCAFNACKTCRQAALVRLQCSASPVDHSQGTGIVLGDPTARRHAANRVRHSMMTRQDVPDAVKDNICYF